MFGSDNARPLLLPIIYDLANLIREGFMRSDKFMEHEKQNHHQFLRRSFDTQSRSNATIQEIDFDAPIDYLRDDTLQVEISEPIVKNILQQPTAEPLIQVLNSNFTLNASVTSIPSTLTRITPKLNLTMEEIENLALQDLNGTVANESIKDVNGSVISPLPLSHRKRPSYLNNKRTPGPLPETCERFTGNLITLLIKYDYYFLYSTGSKKNQEAYVYM
jgi:hypothetical protein